MWRKGGDGEGGGGRGRRGTLFAQRSYRSPRCPCPSHLVYIAAFLSGRKTHTPGRLRVRGKIRLCCVGRLSVGVAVGVSSSVFLCSYDCSRVYEYPSEYQRRSAPVLICLSFILPFYICKSISFLVSLPDYRPSLYRAFNVVTQTFLLTTRVCFEPYLRHPGDTFACILSLSVDLPRV